MAQKLQILPRYVNLPAQLFINKSQSPLSFLLINKFRLSVIVFCYIALTFTKDEKIWKYFGVNCKGNIFFTFAIFNWYLVFLKLVFSTKPYILSLAATLFTYCQIQKD